ncbi:hypothetical protein G7Y89_g6029 [Cudoniella acicularis]|uniref:Bacteriophage T5 Orf172 DNA-binding domain-containing protein n=1 Tax=Cudoniella acicularis TaxID=354080 RepID=A0A8H4RLC2_9HELO|nr:hypothetical protein G7Y89_g6029 [Cudoniella acicularis]
MDPRRHGLIEEVPNALPESSSAATLPATSDPFTPDFWDNCDFASTLHPSGHLRTVSMPVELPMRSRDDTFPMQSASSPADRASNLDQPFSEDDKPNTFPERTAGSSIDSTSSFGQPSSEDDEPDTFPEQTASSPVDGVLSLDQPSLEDDVPDTTAANEMRSTTETTLGPKDIDNKILKYLREAKSNKGHIGKTVDIRNRIKQLKRSCDLYSLEKVKDNQDEEHLWYEKVETLVHLELKNFRQEIYCERCKGGGGKNASHKEWFDVSEKVALDTVQRWRKFVLQEPYNPDGTIKDYWGKLLSQNNFEPIADDEEANHHEKKARSVGDMA